MSKTGKDLGNIFYVYIYFDPRDEKLVPIYVGKGKGNRAWKHLQSKTHNFFIRTLNKIRKDGVEPKVVIYDDGLSEDEAFETEIRLIKKFGRRNLNEGTLCNLTDSGEGLSGTIFSEERKKKMSEGNKGKVVSEEVREKLRIANIGKKHTEETKEKISEALKGRPSACRYARKKTYRRN